MCCLNKRKRLRELMKGEKHFFLMEAHDGISAKIVEEAGFQAIWASGLSITAALGVRDNNELSYTQLLSAAEYMNDACDLPILVDGDTGYGNFNNACKLLRKLEDRGIAGVCVEDKKFPKTNSFLENKLDALADPEEFAGKIRAMKAAQLTDDFTVVARLESLIVGAGIEDAIMRAEMYLDAGADALLVHSKRSDSRDIDRFLVAFGRDVPVFIVPTKYYSVPVEHLTRDKRVRGIIWANHNIRACIKAMQEVCGDIFKDSSIAGVEDSVATVSEIFRLQKNDEYLEMEKKYLPPAAPSNALILAAGSPGSLRIVKPKPLLSINGYSILQRQITALHSVGVSKITVVRGFEKEMIDVSGVTFLDNDDWEHTSVMGSLAMAAAHATMPYAVLYGDVFFKRYLLRMLVDTSGESRADMILVCTRENYIDNGYAFRTDCACDPFETGSEMNIIKVMKGGLFPESNAEGETLFFSGLMMVRNYEAVNRLLQSSDVAYLHSGDFFNRAIADGLELEVMIASADAAVDINSVSDLVRAGEIS